MRKADFITTENCNKEVDRLREVESSLRELLEEKQAEIAKLKAQLKAQGEQEPVCKGKWVCTCGTNTDECIGTNDTCGYRPQVPDGWLRAIDEALVCWHLGVANATDTCEQAKEKLHKLINIEIAVATDPAVNGGMVLVPRDRLTPDGYTRTRRSMEDKSNGIPTMMPNVKYPSGAFTMQTGQVANLTVKEGT